jgi:uncharacterized membrane protein
MSLIPWIIFGTIRLCSEISYYLEDYFMSIMPQIIFIIISFIIILLLSCTLYIITNKRMKYLWMLNSLMEPLI